MSEKLVLKNVTIKWPHLDKPNTKGDFASGKYEVTLVLSEDQAVDLKGRISPKQHIKLDKDNATTITVKSKLPPRVLNKEGLPMSIEDIQKIGNGSVANVRLALFEVRGSVFAGVDTLLMKDIKEYTANSVADLMDDDTVQSTGAAGLLDDDE